MKYFSILILFIVVFLNKTSGQQAAQYSMYMLNPYEVNPAYAGVGERLQVNGVFRKQWTGLEGSPTTQSVNVHFPLFYLSGGVGLRFENDVIGAEQSTKALLSFNYQYEVGDFGKLVLGASGGMLQKRLDGRLLRSPEGVYEGGTFTHNDPELPEGLVRDIVPVFDVGVLLKGKLFEIGLSANNISEPNIVLETMNVTNLLLKRNYFLTFVTDLELSENVRVRPSALFKSNGVQVQGEFSVLLQYGENILGGVSWRGYNANTSDAIALIAGLKITGQLRLSYAFDIGMSSLNTAHQGSHEIQLNYELDKVIGKGKQEKIIYNPRFL